MNVVIIKYNAGNVVSVTNTLNRLGVEPTLSDDPELIKRADKVISLPMFGRKDSLNVAVAFGIAAYEINKTRISPS